EKVLGIFRKGTGIGDAVKALDAATTDIKAKEAAAAKFKAAYTSYIAILEKTANDPKDVKSADKSAYISAIITLKLALVAIDKDACRPQQQGETVKKAPPSGAKSSDALVKEAQAHIA